MVKRRFFKRAKSGARQGEALFISTFVPKSLANQSLKRLSLLFDRADKTFEVDFLIFRSEDDQKMIRYFIEVKYALICQERHLHEIAAIHSLDRHVIVGEKRRRQGTNHRYVNFGRQRCRYHLPVARDEQTTQNAVLPIEGV